MAGEERVAYVDGEYVPASEAVVPISNVGFSWGYTVNDTLRTFNREPHALREHTDRLLRSARAARMELAFTRDDLKTIVRELLDRNVETLDRDDVEFIVSLNVTGDWELYPEPGEAYPPSRLYVRCVPLDFSSNASVFVDGRRVVTSSVRQPPPDCLPPNVKHRSRLHLVVADKQAKAADSTARPLLLDANGCVTETVQANLFIVTDGVLRTPPARKVLAGVTRERVMGIARELGREVAEEDLTTYDVHTADEAFFTSTTRVLTPIATVDGIEIGTGRPGAVAEELLSAYSDRVGVDIVAQFLRRMDPATRPEQLRLGGDRGG